MGGMVTQLFALCINKVDCFFSCFEDFKFHEVLRVFFFLLP